MNNKTISLLLMMTLVICASCTSTKKLTYLQDMPVDMPIRINNQDETHIKPGDRLNIKVSSKNAELAAPFNGSSFTVSQTGVPNISGLGTEGEYLVDADGDITFPILGKLHVVGLTMPQISEYIQMQLIVGKHIPDATVETTITNFTIYALGALGPAKLTVPEGHVNLLQAVAQLGDMKQGKIKKVRVIREFAGVRQEYNVDMRTKALYDSPAFFLQQNDIVYVEPRRSFYDNSQRTMSYIGFLSTLVSMGFMITYIIK